MILSYRFSHAGSPPSNIEESCVLIGYMKGTLLDCLGLPDLIPHTKKSAWSGLIGL